jgi:adenine-specific DNA methylase
VCKWGEWIKQEAEKELGEFYPKDPDGATPIAYLWARTIHCEGPCCGAEVPLLRSLWLAKKGGESVALRLTPNPTKKGVGFEIIENAKAKDVGEGTVRRGAASCPACGYTTQIASIRRQLKARHGGARDARLFCVVTTRGREQGHSYRLPTERDLLAVEKARTELERRKARHRGTSSLVPDEEISLNEIRRISVPLYGMTSWDKLFSARQLLALSTLTRLVGQVNVGGDCTAREDTDLVRALQTCLALAVDRQADYLTSLTVWSSSGQFIAHTFGRQAIPMVWEWPECQPFAHASGNWNGAINWIALAITTIASGLARSGHAQQCSAGAQSLPNDAGSVLFTDPPYYDAVPYAYLSDFFYVWLRRSLVDAHPALLEYREVPKEEEIVVDRPHTLSRSHKDVAFYERELTKAFADSRRVLAPDGIGAIVFASKTTASWEAILQAVVDAGWTITASWPIDTEREARVSAIGQARLASSIHLVCRPRENPDGSVRTDVIGDWRDVLAELPRRIHDWMPRLAEEGVVGADAIFACLGPALEIFSRYSRVEKASGEAVTLKEYLEHVWAAVAKEALTMIFAGADATGFEEDARLTAMWLWTLRTGADPTGGKADDEEEGPDQEGEPTAKKPPAGGFSLEYDAARKIAQGLGAHLEELRSVVEVKGEKARLLPVSERARYLFAKTETPTVVRRARKSGQQALFADAFVEPDSTFGDLKVDTVGDTALDRVHQSMLLFAAGRTEALRRFLVEDAVGSDQRFWRLAQALSALYPVSSEEKRWVDGLLAKKKGLGF